MKHKTVYAAILFFGGVGIVIFFLTWTNPIERKNFGFNGMGTINSPYEINCVEDLIRFRDWINSGVTSFEGVYFRQTTDLDLIGIDDWIPIGDFIEPAVLRNYFRGHYDGAGHIITNLTVLGDGYGGLFSFLGGEVKNLGIESGYIEGSCVGSIASHGSSLAVITNCYNKAKIHGIYRAGGIADNLGGGKIEYCWNMGEVSADSGLNYGISSYDAMVNGCYCIDLLPAPESQCIVYETTSFSLKDLKNVDNMRKIDGDYSNDTKLIKIEGKTISFDHGEENSKFLVWIKKYWILTCFVMCSIILNFIAFVHGKKNEPVIDEVIEKKVYSFEKINNDNRKNLLYVFLFLIIFFLGTSLINQTLMQKQDGFTGPFIIKNYYKQPEESIDVLLMGNSGVGMNLSCEELWKGYGISSYALWGYASPFWNSYYYLKEAVKANKPKVLVLEVATVAYRYEHQENAPQYSNTIGIKSFLNRLQAVQISSPQDRWMDLIFGFPIYHTRFSELTKDDFTYFFSDTDSENEKGSAELVYGSSNLPLESVPRITEVKNIYYKQEKYLRKMIEYCQEENIKVLLIKTPTPARAYNQPYYNAVSEIADEYEIPFINFNLLDKETGLNENDFFTDNYHLNVYGARKVSSYLGNYLVSNYMLLDHRGDENYKSWDIFANNMENKYLKLITEADDYFSEIARNDRIVIVMKRDLDIKSETYYSFLLKLADTGLDLNFLEEDGKSCYVVNKLGKQRYNPTKECYIRIDNRDIMIDFMYSGGVFIDEEEIYTLPESGIVCMVYDSFSKDIIDITVFSEEMQYTAVHQ